MTCVQGPLRYIEMAEIYLYNMKLRGQKLKTIPTSQGDI